MGVIGREPDREFATAFARLKARGPDASHTWQTAIGPWQIELGHHRLAILDLESGSQPMTRDGVTVAFNGEIYNFPELARQLVTPPISRSDTEVLLRLFMQEGEAAFARLDGFFAAGFVNEVTQSVTLVRDPFGIKPLYFAPRKDGGLMFASELSAFTAQKSAEWRLSRRALANYLFAEHIPGDATILKGVYKLRPGHYLTWRSGHSQIHRYFEPRELLAQPRRWTHPEELWQLILTAVKGALIADVPVGVLLSGGLDSSLLALATRELLGPDFPTFAIGFADRDFDESSYARQVARAVGSRHTERVLTEADLLERWPGIINQLDEPLADPSILPTRLLCEMAREQVKVALGGDGGDELFGGYPTYRAHAMHGWLAAVPDLVMHSLKKVVNNHLKMGDGYQPLAWRLKRLIGRFDQDPIRCHFRWMAVTDPPDISALVGGEIDLLKDPEFGREIEALDPEDPETYLLLDLTHYLAYSVLTKVDRASMAVGLECRPPLLSKDLVAEAFRLPWAQKVDGDETKVALREILRGKLPAAITERAKRGFAIPLVRWLRGPLRPRIERLIRDGRLVESGALKQDQLVRIWDRFLDNTGDYSRTLWAILVVEQWLENHPDLKWVDDLGANA